jgi:hypothetical protein
MPVAASSVSQIVAVKVLKWLDLLVPLGISIYCAQRNIGFYLLIENLQLHFFGSYSDVLTSIASFLAVFLPFHFLIRFVAARTGLPFDTVRIGDGDSDASSHSSA